MNEAQERVHEKFFTIPATHLSNRARKNKDGKPFLAAPASFGCTAAEDRTEHAGYYRAATSGAAVDTSPPTIFGSGSEKGW